MGAALPPKNVRQPSSNLFGDASVALGAHEFFNVLRMEESDTSESGPRYGDPKFEYFDTFWQQVQSTDSSDERKDHLDYELLKTLGLMDPNTLESEDSHINNKGSIPIREVQKNSGRLLGASSDVRDAESPVYQPLQTPCVGNYMARELIAPKRSHRHFPLIGSNHPDVNTTNGCTKTPSLQGHADSDSSTMESRSASGGTVEIHSPSSPTISSDLNVSECELKLFCLFS